MKKNIIAINNKNQDKNIKTSKINNYKHIILKSKDKILNNSEIKHNKNNENDSKNFNLIQKIETLNDGILIWIDENYKNLENSSYLRLLEKNKNLTIKCFDNVNNAFNFLFQKKNKNNENIIDKLNLELFLYLSVEDYILIIKKN